MPDATPREEPVVARPPTSEGNTPATQPLPQPCAGMPADAVSPRVQEFLTCEVIQILAKPDLVQSFKVKPDPDTTVPEDKRLGDYPIEPHGEGAKLTAEQLKDLQSLVFSEKSYVFGAEKRCQFRPEMGLHFIKGQEAVDILFSFECDLWLFLYKKEKNLEDFDPIRKQLEELYKSLLLKNNTLIQN